MGRLWQFLRELLGIDKQLKLNENKKQLQYNSSMKSVHKKPKSYQPHRRTKAQGTENKYKLRSQPNHWQIDQFVVPEQVGKLRFHDFELPDALMQAVHALNFQYCTAIQAEILGPTLNGKDAIGKAQTGTGKTAAFLIAVIKQLIETPAPDKRYLGEPRAIIVAPTRELAIQIHQDAKALTRYTSIHSEVAVGGMDYGVQKDKIERHFVDIVVATPGRLLDFLERKDLHLDLVEIVVLDEADRMLDMGFIPQVRRILRRTPRPGDRQTLLFSATFSSDVMHLVDQWTWYPIKVEIDPGNIATKNIDQKVYLVSSADKYQVLRNFLKQKKHNRAIIFSNRRDETRALSEKLQSDGIKCVALSGEVPQKQRVQVLNLFKQGIVKVMVATDVAGRGIHVDGVSHVINYSLPENAEDYVHRIGRAGRAGSKGESISFACEDDSFLIPDLEKMLGQKISFYPIPSELLH